MQRSKQSRATCVLTMTSLALLFTITADAWSERQRNSDGRIESSKEKFPGGMKALGDYIHSKGELSVQVCKRGVCNPPCRCTGSESGSTSSAATANVRAVLLEICQTGI